ncbi:Uncharacterised protein [Chryseobacterium gleum]|jgi:hypothetical protein|uniref:Uncharacterized protein n=2 Tax=Chryseobacterium gleum TaxID=250 RepID=A0A448B540_CHRGE|nr:hypothetical protein [Chryseobacterium gleum]EFK37461.1 hypothetical protein HMPREF0204_10234 [Chryseobacterium gleum ATCC 35910]QQY33038.1 hypothetical protein I6I60_04410 [Chryseobacterium gleum]VEE09594.1 Uncharacterised protein [Chryseobacterium gleum]
MKKIYVFGNGNISWDNFHQFYIEPIKQLDWSKCEFLIGDFNGTDTLMMEFLKDKTSNVTILHIGEKPRYFVNRFNCQAGNWKTIGGFQTDKERDKYAMTMCTHFLGIDFNSDERRKSGTLQNIKACFDLGKIKI